MIYEKRSSCRKTFKTSHYYGERFIVKRTRSKISNQHLYVKLYLSIYKNFPLELALMNVTNIQEKGT